jgi:predicted ArsR family transcriptional regulator
MRGQSIGVQEIRVFQAMRAHSDQWLTCREIADQASVTEPAAHTHLTQFAEQGVAEIAAEVLPPRYRLRRRDEMPHPDRLDRLIHAVDTLSGLAGN